MSRNICLSLPPRLGAFSLEEAGSPTSFVICFSFSGQPCPGCKLVRPVLQHSHEAEDFTLYLNSSEGVIRAVLAC
jgi:hypothetical protein